MSEEPNSASPEPKPREKEGWSFLWVMGLAAAHYVVIIASLRPPLETWLGLLVPPLLAGLTIGAADLTWKTATQTRSRDRGCAWYVVLVAYLVVYQMVGWTQVELINEKRKIEARRK